jgi:hypothetical protein
MKDAGDLLLKAMNFMNFTSKDILSRPWASATFSGARHKLTLRLQGEDAPDRADAFLADLVGKEFPMRGHILADICLISQTRTSGPAGPDIELRIEALTVEAD